MAVPVNLRCELVVALANIQQSPIRATPHKTLGMRIINLPCKPRLSTRKYPSNHPPFPPGTPARYPRATTVIVVNLVDLAYPQNLVLCFPDTFG
jgi:hypothetical protein